MSSYSFDSSFPRRLLQLQLGLVVGLRLPLAGQAQGLSCEALRASIAAKFQDHGVASYLLRLTQALERRGHAAMDKLRLDDARVLDIPGATATAAPALPLQDLLDALTPARGHPLWETPPGKRSDTDDGARNACVMDVAREVDKRLPVAQ